MCLHVASLKTKRVLIAIFKMQILQDNAAFQSRPAIYCQSQAQDLLADQSKQDCMRVRDEASSPQFMSDCGRDDQKSKLSANDNC